MKTQTNAQSQPSNKLTIHKETIRVLINQSSTPAAASPTAECSLTC